MIASLAVLAVAAMLTGRPGTDVQDVAVCPADWGCADIPGNIIHVRPEYGWYLSNITETDPYQAARAVLVFCHEARHVRGTTNERIAERWAVAHVFRVSRLLGASEDQARQIKHWVPFWDERISA